MSLNIPAMKIPTMNISSPKSTSGLTSKSSAVSFKMPKMPSSSFKIAQPKIPKAAASPSFNFGKFTKMPKAPKVAKVKILKAAVKKAKNVGF